eukprot:5750171-Alexandrium_andersonii.AAC.1
MPSKITDLGKGSGTAGSATGNSGSPESNNKRCNHAGDSHLKWILRFSSAGRRMQRALGG